MEKLSKFILIFSYQEKRKRKFKNYKQDVEDLRKMPMDELQFERIEVKTEYEHRKVCMLLIAFGVMAVLVNAWKQFFSFVELVAGHVSSVSVHNSEEILITAFWIVLMWLFFITIISLFALHESLVATRKALRKLLIIEMVKELDG